MKNKTNRLFKVVDGVVKEMNVSDNSLEYGLSLGWTKEKPKKAAKKETTTTTEE